jgi:hypothetical protein
LPAKPPREGDYVPTANCALRLHTMAGSLYTPYHVHIACHIVHYPPLFGPNFFRGWRFG